MGRTVIHGQSAIEESKTDRQERITWWSQKAIRDARIMVVGAGAIGNEVIKNLCLMGFGHIFIADMDTISVTNLSRTVLFTEEDIGKYKAEVAALKAREMSVCPDVEVQAFVGNIVHKLGTGIFRQFDLVLGCLDNYECRIDVNKRCNQLGIPYIDGGIWELSWSVQLFHYPHSSCLACGDYSIYQQEKKRRYSCAVKQLRQIEEEKVPTIQVASASAGSFMVQEAAKYLNGQEVRFGKKYYFDGMINEFETIRIRPKEDCLFHESFDNITITDMTNQLTLSEFLNRVSLDHGGEIFYIDVYGDYLFTKTARCRNCGRQIDLYTPDYNIYMEDLYCEDCMAQEAFVEGVYADCEDIVEFKDNDEKLRDMTLEQLGIPKGHIVRVRNIKDDEECYYYELSADIPELMGDISLRG